MRKLLGNRSAKVTADLGPRDRLVLPGAIDNYLAIRTRSRGSTSRELTDNRATFLTKIRTNANDTKISIGRSSPIGVSPTPAPPHDNYRTRQDTIQREGDLTIIRCSAFSSGLPRRPPGLVLALSPHSFACSLARLLARSSARSLVSVAAYHRLEVRIVIALSHGKERVLESFGDRREKLFSPPLSPRFSAVSSAARHSPGLIWLFRLTLPTAVSVGKVIVSLASASELLDLLRPCCDPQDFGSAAYGSSAILHPLRPRQPYDLKNRDMRAAVSDACNLIIAQNYFERESPHTSRHPLTSLCW